MSVWSSLLAGIVQGISEFLPISSTAHLTLFGHAAGVIDQADPARWTAYIAIIQLGTLFSVLTYFWQDLVGITCAAWREIIVERRRWSAQSDQARLAILIALGTIPVVLFGLLLRDVIEGPWTKSLVVIGGAQIIFSLLLWFAERAARHERGAGALTWKDALSVGFGQACALIPGASRSGTTLTAALLRGIERPAAARFSFLLSIPAILLSGLFEASGAVPSLTTASALSYLVGIVSAAVSGYLSIAFLIRFLQRNTTLAFIAYRLALGVAILIVSAW